MRKWLCGTHLSKKIDMLSTFAEALAYSFVLSIVPFMVIGFALTTELIGNLNAKSYEVTLERVLPLEGGNHNDVNFAAHITSAIETWRESGTARTIGFLFAVYTCFNLMNQIVRTLLFIFDDQRRAFEWSWRVFSKTIALFAVWTFLLLAVTVATVFGIFVHEVFVQDKAEYLAVPWVILRDLGMVAALFGAVFATYYLVPGKRHRLRVICDGAMVASVGWICSGLVFEHVLPKMLGLNLVYQALGSVVVILLWAQACAWSLIIGACWMVRFPGRGKN